MAATFSRVARLTSTVVQVALVALLGYGLVTGALGLATNVALTLIVVLVPLFVQWRFERPLGPALTLWIALAAAVHTGGVVGLYGAFGWYDQFAHGVSGALIAGVGYALVRTVETQVEGVVVPADLRILFVVVFTGAVGVAWEVGEFGLELLAGRSGDALLAQYGLSDVVLDLALNLVAAVVVGVWTSGPFDGLRAILEQYVGEAEGDRSH